MAAFVEQATIVATRRRLILKTHSGIRSKELGILGAESGTKESNSKRPCRSGTSRNR